jgi:Xaa-Pro aminopeptidase
MSISRIEKLQKTLPVEAFLITNPIDLFYFTGLDLSTGKLLVKKSEATLFVDGRYIEAAIAKSPIPVILANEKTFLENLKGVSALGIDSETTSYQGFLDLEKLGIVIKPLKGVISLLRAVKEFSEIELLKKAADLGSLGHDFVVSLLQEGVSEKDLAFELEYFWKKKGAEGVGFDPIIAFGANSSMPHYRAGDTKLKSGDIVLIDIGVKLDHYYSDMTRVHFFGTPNPKLVEIRDLVLKAHHLAVELLKPGVTIGAVDDAARLFIASNGYGEHFNHGLGHGVGLEIHEYPTVRRVADFAQVALEEGMVITIEPGIYLPKIGGVRIEDTLVITKSGSINLTNRPYV